MFFGTINKISMKVFGLALLVNGFIVIAEYIAVAPIGTHFLLPIAHFAMLPLLVASLAVPVSVALLFWRRYRTTGLKTLLACIIYLIVGIAGIRLAVDVRHNGFVSLAQRSRPLVMAIQQFETKYGKPPENLEQLVPDFLPDVPKTGIGAYPNYEYVVVDDKTAYEGNPWVLKVNTPHGGINWDTFLYFPKQNYPKTGYGGVLVRIEDWAYVHE
jgi:uncharacterized membrane protein YhaH (DUF805 family)